MLNVLPLEHCSLNTSHQSESLIGNGFENSKFLRATIFPRARAFYSAGLRLSPLWIKEEIPGTRYGVSDKGRIDKELFHFWLKDHFLLNVVSRRPLLLLLDGHSSHFEPATIEFAKENDIIIFVLPPHTTHECQPLDLSFLGALKKHWQFSCHEFYQNNPGKVISKLNFSKMHG